MIFVDRIEGNIVIAQTDGGFIKISADNILGSVKDGDILIKSKDGYTVDKEATELRRKTMFKRQQKLFNKD